MSATDTEVVIRGLSVTVIVGSGGARLGFGFGFGFGFGAELLLGSFEGWMECLKDIECISQARGLRLSRSTLSL